MIGPRMPSPIGHALAGVAVAWAADLVPGDRAWRGAPRAAPWYQRAGDGVTLLCAGLAMAPDLDLAFTEHRMVTHSIGAVCVVALIAVIAAAAARRPIARISAMCAAAYASHLLLDWLGIDHYAPYGLQALWPINRQWYISGIDLFRQTARFHLFTRAVLVTNVRAMAQEAAILGPIVVALWLVRVKALAGLTSQLPRGDHPAVP
jgi:membrane-bound metal-dependent hydrolase YbcI (DUF457 family)